MDQLKENEEITTPKRKLFKTLSLFELENQQQDQSSPFRID